MANLIQTILGALPADLIARIGGILGEDPGPTAKGFQGATAAMLAGAAQQATTPNGASNLLDQVRQATLGGNPLDQIGTIFPADETRLSAFNRDSTQASALLGGTTNQVVSQLASFAGLGGQSASAIIAMAGPLVMGALARLLGPHPTASGLQSLLAEQRSDIFGVLPSGMRSLFGPVTGAASAAAAAAAPAASGIGRWLPWLLAGIVLIGLLLALKNCNEKEAPVTISSPAPIGTLPASVLVRLPGGASINVPENSIGFSVARFLESNEPAPKTFVFDNLNFDTASNALTPESKPTVDALAAILKAYPNAQSRVVGYTDNQGDPAANKTLSDARATTVKNELVARGIDGARIEKAGMGEENPLASNATEEGRAQNRRTELQIVKK